MTAFLSRLDSRASNLGRMMDRCGVDRVELARDRLGQTMLSVARACIACPHGERCRLWLEAAAEDVVNRPPAFCPNAGRFRLRQLH
ncbi:hypothetical protein SAMN06265365_105187 [Tistlia consotensis]|uniref:DUF6455 domain-containing protein n=1 Tax=Tistlia consotensis USBA 355 TaxID=560819 RepID=A0A1Y6BJG9_9PROT|nr:DUF6455 family protein [Tistlia consotensis]SMF12836.1 hypothetical protein SAMN05428998_105111 [Tistlia consotensis USBA 355]SNR50890.1 hypothetical protein SAMN06265365_105187 [Tistlia consotensis]